MDTCIAAVQISLFLLIFLGICPFAQNKNQIDFFLIFFGISAPETQISCKQVMSRSYAWVLYIYIYPPRTDNSHQHSITQFRAGAYIAVVKKNSIVFFGYLPLTLKSHANESCRAVMRGRYIGVAFSTRL